MSNIWHAQTFPNVNWLKFACKETLSDQYIQEWEQSVENSSKSRWYKLFKNPV